MGEQQKFVELQLELFKRNPYCRLRDFEVRVRSLGKVREVRAKFDLANSREDLRELVQEYL